MPSLRAFVRLALAGLLGAGAALLVACGGADKLIPRSDAGRINGHLARVADAVARQDCATAESELRLAQREVDALPDTLDQDLRRRINEGLVNLAGLAPRQCEAAPPATTEPPTTSGQTEPPATTGQTEPPPATGQTEPPTTTPTTPPATAPGQGATQPGQDGLGGGAAAPGAEG